MFFFFCINFYLFFYLLFFILFYFFPARHKSPDNFILSQILLTLCLRVSITKFVTERLQSVVKRALISNEYAWEAISPNRSNMSAEIRFNSDNVRFIRDTVSQGFNKWERDVFSMAWQHQTCTSLFRLWIESRLLRRGEIVRALLFWHWPSLPL